MNRLLIIIISIMLLSNGYSQNKGFARWSFAPEYGYNIFDGDVNQIFPKIIPASGKDITYGLNIDYALTPVWGLSMGGYHYPLHASHSSPVPMEISTNMYGGDFLASINFTRLIYPNSGSKVYVLGSFGVGMAYYQYNLTYTTGVPIGAGDTYVDRKLGGTIRPIRLYDGGALLNQGVAASFPIALALEYNFSRPLAAGMKVQYRAYNKDDLEGATYLNYNGVTNDFVGVGSVYLRWKPGAISKKHVRDVKMDDFAPGKSVRTAQQLEDRMKKLEKKVDGISAKVDSLTPRVARLERMLSNDGPDSDGDGVPDVRDNDNTTPQNTPVDFWGREIPIEQYQSGISSPSSGYSAGSASSKSRSLSGDSRTNSSSAASGGKTGSATKSGSNAAGYYGGSGSPQSLYFPEEELSVYFGYDQISLDDNALIVISKVATRMKKDPSLFVEVRGYCDYSGSNPYNNLLSQRRADRVKEELVRVWGIPFDHVISNGKGKVIEPRSKYRPNRRCDFYFGKL